MEFNHETNNPDDPTSHESLESKPLEVMILERSKLLQVCLSDKRQKSSLTRNVIVDFRYGVTQIFQLVTTTFCYYFGSKSYSSYFILISLV